MSQKSATHIPIAKPPAERVVRDIRRATRRHYASEDKIRIVLEALRDEDIAVLCRREGTAVSYDYASSIKCSEATTSLGSSDFASSAPRTAP